MINFNSDDANLAVHKEYTNRHVLFYVINKGVKYVIAKDSND